jgi:ERCC4-type nuclease
VLFVDPRSGSKELVRPLSKAGLPVDASTQLEAGDLFFVGRGDKGAATTIGIEHKKVADLIASLRTGRLQGVQLPGMRAAEAGATPLYDYAYLMVEGEITWNEQGKLTRRVGARAFREMAGGMTISELQKRILVMSLCAGLMPIFTSSQKDSVQWIVSLYRTWTDCNLDEHKSHLALYQPPTLTPLSQFRKTISTLPGVGLRVSKEAERLFGGSIRTAVNADIETWAALTTKDEKGKSRRLGLSTAIKIAEAIE